jgi:hypothetical protein
MGKLPLVGVCDITCNCQRSVEFLRQFTSIEDPFSVYDIRGRVLHDKVAAGIMYHDCGPPALRVPMYPIHMQWVKRVRCCYSGVAAHKLNGVTHSARRTARMTTLPPPPSPTSPVVGSMPPSPSLKSSPEPLQLPPRAVGPAAAKRGNACVCTAGTAGDSTRHRCSVRALRTINT